MRYFRLMFEINFQMRIFDESKCLYSEIQLDSNLKQIEKLLNRNHAQKSVL